eukprot:c4634_g1_i1.p1 GENE.c4634_g1_i1~~c4634_g1_i1.p1  ORF type:complete len:141 (-),score=33.89 c4634_g1_i1:27-419(-)
MSDDEGQDVHMDGGEDDDGGLDDTELVEEDDVVIGEGADPNPQQDAHAVDKAHRTTTPYLTKYERARVLGARALQIAMNAPVMVELGGETDPLAIARMELRARKIPIVIRRFMPDGKTYEDWAVSELIVD